MNKIVCLLLSFVLVFGLVACGPKDDFENLADGEYILYYTDAKASAVTSYIYKSEKTDTLEIVKELIDSMKNISAEGAVSVLPEKMTFGHADINEGILYVYFSGGASSFTNASRLVFVSSITKALSSLKEIEGVQIYDDEGIMKDSNGDAYDVLRPENFVSLETNK